MISSMSIFLERHLLSAVIFSPLISVLWLYLFPRKREDNLFRAAALLWSLLTFALSLLIFARFKQGEPGMQLVERHEWMQSLGIEYLLGVDGISLFLILLTTFLTPIVIISSQSVHKNILTYLSHILLP